MKYPSYTKAGWRIYGSCNGSFPDWHKAFALNMVWNIANWTMVINFK